jgi:hypothetical protein
MDQERGGSGELRDTAVSLMRCGTMIAVHADFSDDDALTAWFTLPEPLPGAREAVGEFLIGLHEWLQGKRAAPKLPAPELRVLH